MKKMIVAWAALLLLVSTQVEAQNSKRSNDRQMPTAEQMAQKRTERLTQKLSLTEAQAKQVYAFSLTQAEADIEHRKQMDRNREEHRQQMEQTCQAADQRMKQILTPEQYAQWEQLNKEKCDGAPGCCKDGPRGRKGGKCGKCPSKQ